MHHSKKLNQRIVFFQLIQTRNYQAETADMNQQVPSENCHLRIVPLGVVLLESNRCHANYDNKLNNQINLIKERDFKISFVSWALESHREEPKHLKYGKKGTRGSVNVIHDVAEIELRKTLNFLKIAQYNLTR